MADNPFASLWPHRRLVLAAFLGWFLDAFDQVSLIILLPEIGRHFSVSLAAMGAVVSVQGIGRVIGTVGWGWLADRFGRKATFTLGVVWFAAFSGLTGAAWSFPVLLAAQFLFGIGFGGEWTASIALLMESVPSRARPSAASLMLVGYECGFVAAAGMQALLVPTFGWRSVFLVGLAPALLAIFIRLGVEESPEWLQRPTTVEPRAVRARFGGAMTLAAGQAFAFAAALQCQAVAVSNFYPTVLKTVHGFDHNAVFWAVAAYSGGAIAGKLTCGWLAQRIGERRAMIACLAITLAVIVPFASAGSVPSAMATALVAGAASGGVSALMPGYIAERFTVAVRSLGMGIAFAFAAGGGAIATYLLPASAAVVGLEHAIEAFAVASCITTALVTLWNPGELPGRDRAGSGDALPL